MDYATRALAENPAAAEIACHEVLELEPRNAQALYLLGYIAGRMGMRDAAIGWLQAALDADPDNARIRENLAAARAMQPAAPPQGLRYLLIKSWGFGFWADMVQVLGSLLLAEVTGRIPVVHWGPESLFSDKSQRDAFTQFFEPVSALSLQDLAGLPNASFLPARWNEANLGESGPSKWEGKGSRFGVPYFLNRRETVAVSDFHIGVINVMPWIPADHPLHGKSLEEIHRALTAKYLRPRPDILAACDAFFQANLAGGPFLALHMRGSDKAIEDPSLEFTNRELLKLLDAQDPSWPIFLMTDDEHCLARMKTLYGARIVATQCQRTTTDEGVHYLQTVDPVRAGREVLIDTLLAMRADRFIGNGRSNVSAMIAVMKDWAPGTCTLLDRSVLADRNLRIYQIPTYAREG
jgi:tetratricopeptide (TPR) repeat protein